MDMIVLTTYQTFTLKLLFSLWCVALASCFRLSCEEQTIVLGRTTLRTQEFVELIRTLVFSEKAEIGFLLMLFLGYIHIVLLHPLLNVEIYGLNVVVRQERLKVGGLLACA